MKYHLMIHFILLFMGEISAQTPKEMVEICSYLVTSKEVDESQCEFVLEKGQSNLHIEKITDDKEYNVSVFFVRSLISGGRSFLYLKGGSDILLLGKYNSSLAEDLAELELFFKNKGKTAYEFVCFAEKIMQHLLLVHKNNSYEEVSRSKKINYIFREL